MHGRLKFSIKNTFCKQHAGVHLYYLTPGVYYFKLDLDCVFMWELLFARNQFSVLSCIFFCYMCSLPMTVIYTLFISCYNFFLQCFFRKLCCEYLLSKCRSPPRVIMIAYIVKVSVYHVYVTTVIYSNMLKEIYLTITLKWERNWIILHINTFFQLERVNIPVCMYHKRICSVKSFKL